MTVNHPVPGSSPGGGVEKSRKMLKVRCKQCGVELTSTNKTQACGCSNQMELIESKISAVDLSQVMIVKMWVDEDDKTSFSNSDIEWQKKRSKRKIRKLDFDVK